MQITKMKDRTWLIVTLVMGLALIISIGYSLKLRKKINESSEVIISRNIVQITASNVSIKNVLKSKGKVEKTKLESTDGNEQENNYSSEYINKENSKTTDENNSINSELNKYYISINLTDDTIKKVQNDQSVEIKITNENETNKYKGKVTKIIQEEDGKKKAIIDFNFDEKVKDNLEAECTIIITEKNDVIALPIASIKTRKVESFSENQNQSNYTNTQNHTNTLGNNPKEEKYVIVVNDDGTTSEVIVETGISDEYYVEIVSGLSEGQKVQIEEE